MNLSLLTYNVLFHKAFPKLGEISEKYRPDIICIQEADTDEASLKKLEILNYRLADYSNSFIKFGKIFGVATFYNAERLKFIKSDSFVIPHSFYQMLVAIVLLLRGDIKSRTVLKTNFVYLPLKKQVTIYNVHLPVVATNEGRIKQIKQFLHILKLDKNEPSIIAGDFNYLPYRRKKLENLMKNYGFREATKKIFYTLQYSKSGKIEQYNLIQRLSIKIFRNLFSTNKIKVDYIFYNNLRLQQTKRIPINHSDHFPIISFFNFT